MLSGFESFPSINKHNKGKDNVVANILSTQNTMLSQFNCCIFGIESIKIQNELDMDFKNRFLNCRT